MGRFVANAPYIVALDFDGTIKDTTSYDLDWTMWKPAPGFKKFYNWAVKQGNLKMVLWTCRNLVEPTEFLAVEAFLLKFGFSEIDLKYSLGEQYEYNGHTYSTSAFGSRKIFADFYVDDLSVGFPRGRFGEPAWDEIRRFIEKVISLRR